MIKTIIFDIGGVYFTSGNKKIVPVLNEKFGISKDKLNQVFEGELSDLYKTGQCTAEYFWTKAKKIWSLHIDVQKLAKIWFNCYEPIEGTIEIVKKLRQNGYEIMYLSDNTQERVAYVEKKHKFLKHFDDGIFSHKVKTRKPDPAIYHLVLEKTSSSANECLFIDDKIKCVKTAKKIGMNGILFKNPEQLKTELANHNVLV